MSQVSTYLRLSRYAPPFTSRSRAVQLGLVKLTLERSYGALAFTMVSAEFTER